MIQPLFLFQERVLNGSDFSQASWVKTNATATANTTAAPDGTVTADTLNDADAVNSGIIAETFAIPADTLARLCIIYLKAGTSVVSSIRVSMTGGVAANVGIAFNPTTGLFTRADSIAGAPSSVTVQQVVTGWWRVAFPYTNNGNTSVTFEIRPAYAGALGGSDLTSTTVLNAASTGTVIAWTASNMDFVLPTWPAAQKPLASQRNVIRHDSITSSGIKQSIVERREVFLPLTFQFVPATDIPVWDNFMSWALDGNFFTYFPDSTDATNSTIYSLEDTSWLPKKAAFGQATFSLNMRVWI